MKGKIIRIVLVLVVLLLFRQVIPVWAQNKTSGSLEIRSIPPDCYVQIDGINVGSTPYKKMDMKQGTYKVTVKNSGRIQEYNIAIIPDVLTVATFTFVKESRVGFYVDDSDMQEQSKGANYTPIDIELPAGAVDYIEIPPEDFNTLKMAGCQRKYNLDALLLLVFTQKTRTSHRDVQVNLNANLYDFNRKKSIYDKRFVQGKEFNRDPEQPDIDDMRLEAFGDFLESFSDFIRKTGHQLKGSGGYRKPVIQNIPMGPAAKDVIPPQDTDKPARWTDKEYHDAILRGLINRDAIPFTLKTRLNKVINSGDYFGKQVVLLYFFDASFAFCKEGLDEVAGFHIENEREFFPIGICISGKGSRRRIAENFLRARLYKFPVVFDTTDMATRYGANDSVPLYVLIDRKGKIRYIKRGTANLAKLLERIKYLYSEK